jgi:hypothetical protein
MPFITLNNNWSSYAPYYNTTNNNGSFAGTANAPNVTNTQKPTIPTDGNQYRLADDGFIRGGALNVALAVRQDVSRLGRFVTRGTDNNARGVLFLLKQVGLQLSNPRLEWRGNPNTPPPLLGGFNRQYTGIGTALSVAGTAFGLHFDQPGLLGNVQDTQKYGGDVDSPVGGVAYFNNFGSDGLGNGTNNFSINKDARNKLLRYTSKITSPTDSNVDNIVLDRYLGGSNSVYGIGQTTVRSYFNRTTVRTDDITGRLKNLLNGFKPLTSEKLGEQTKALVDPITNAVDLTSVLNTSPLYSINDVNNNIEAKLGVSTPSKVDSINVIKIVNSKVFYEDNKKKKTSEVADAISTEVKNKVDGDFGKDLIKFRIEFLNNNVLGTQTNSGTIVNTDVLAFRAYIDNFDDGMTAKWSPYRYMGRGEEFFVYDGFTRDIGVAFTIFAHTRAELDPIYDKLNYLMSTFTPDYSSQLKMRGNIGYLTVGDYIFRQPGVFTDIKIGGLFDGPWNVGLNNNDSRQPITQHYGDNELPMMLKINLSFKPIHTFLPRKTTANSFIPFIGVDRRAYPYKEVPST